MTTEDILKDCTVDGTTVKLPAIQLERKAYEAVKKRLEGIGGKWKGGKTQGFVFDYDPSELLGQVSAGEIRNLKKEIQYFPTPYEIAERLTQLVVIDRRDKVLEPSAGRGALIDAIHRLMGDDEFQIDAFEIDEVNRTFLKNYKSVNLIGHDFLQTDLNLKEAYDVIIANPPFNKNQDVQHIQKMWECLKPGGTLVTIASIGWQYASVGKALAFRNWLDDKGELSAQEWHLQAQIGTDAGFSRSNGDKVSLEAIDAGAFKESGTTVRTTIIRIEKSLIQPRKVSDEDFVNGNVKKIKLKAQICRVCGCHENDCSQCIEKTGHPCHWVERDLCSACQDEQQRLQLSNHKNSNKMELKEIPLKDIIISKTNPRKTFDELSIEELAQSIIQKGVLQPIVVRINGKPGKYEIVCGERRYRASLKAQVAQKSITTIPCVIRELTNDEALELQIIENLQRKDVHPMEEAVAFKGLMDLKKFDVQEIARRIGKGPAYVAQRLKMNDLIDEFQKAFYQDRMTIKSAMMVCKLSAADQKEYWKDDFEGSNGSVDVRDWDIKQYLGDLLDAPFDTKDETLNKKMGACTNCPFNSASNSLLFPEEAHKATCTNSSCYKEKSNVGYGVELKRVLEDPAVVLISGYSHDKEAKELIKKGNVVYTSYEYTEEDKPEPPELSDYEENLEDGDYDSREEMMEAYGKEVENYQKELQAYEKKLSSGKFLRGFHVEGNDKGKYICLTLKKGVQAKNTASAHAASGNTGEAADVNAEDIKAEIQRIRDNEKRKKELDLEKIHYATNDLMQKNKKFKENGGPLSIEEMRAAILYVFENNYSAKKAGEKFFKSSSNYSNADLNIFRKMEEMKPAELAMVFNLMLRAAILDKIAPVNGGRDQRPEANGHAAAFAAISKLYEAPAIKEIEMNQLAERAKREERVDSRIKSLQKKLKESPKAKKGK